MKNPRVVSRMKMLGVVGAAALPTLALIITAGDDETWERLRSKFKDIARETYYVDKRITAAEYAKELGQFLGAADPTGNAGDLVTLAMIYHALSIE